MKTRKNHPAKTVEIIIVELTAEEKLQLSQMADKNELTAIFKDKVRDLSELRVIDDINFDDCKFTVKNILFDFLKIKDLRMSNISQEWNSYQFCILPDALFKDSTIHSCNFSSSKLQMANFENATISYTTFKNANLLHASFKNATIHKINLVDATFHWKQIAEAKQLSNSPYFNDILKYLCNYLMGPPTFGHAGLLGKKRAEILFHSLIQATKNCAQLLVNFLDQGTVPGADLTTNRQRISFFYKNRPSSLSQGSLRYGLLEIYNKHLRSDSRDLKHSKIQF